MRWGRLFGSFAVLLLALVLVSCVSKEKQAEKHFKRGFEYQDQGDLDRALAEYQKALELNPNYVQVYTNLGTVYLGKKDFDLAIQNFKKVIELNYWDKKAHYNLGVAYIYRGELEQAEKEAEFLKSIRSDLGDALARKIVEAESEP